MKWPDRNEIDGETERLMHIVNGWVWNWPGWKWVASSLNAEYGNNRSAEACRKKYHSEELKAAANKAAFGAVFNPPKEETPPEPKE